ncbi:hypothetical protein BHM03_00020359 [Ensete ventricosum]|nr:hypothetical protein BHM03_00020359 [Ensete ventricosum]
MSKSVARFSIGLFDTLLGLEGCSGAVLAESRNIASAFTGENKIDASPAIRWRRPCMRVAVCLSIDQEKLLREHGDVEAGGRKGRGSDNESRGAHLPKSKALVINEDSGECHNAVKADLPIAKKGTQMQGNG